MKNLFHQQCIFIIEKFLKDYRIVNSFANQVKIAKKLLLIKPFEFWEKSCPPDNKPLSLTWFLIPEGKEYMEKQQKLLDLEIQKTKTIELAGEKFGEDKEIKNIKRGLLDYLK